MTSVKIIFPHDFAEGLIGLVDELLRYGYVEDDDKLVVAALDEVKRRLQVRMINYRKAYTITLTPVQSLALRILYTDFIDDPTSRMGSKLMMIANEVHQKFK